MSTQVSRQDVRAVCAKVDAGSNKTHGAQLERMRQYMAETYVWRKERGLCVKCGKEPAEAGKVLGTGCRLFHNQSRSGARV